MFKGILPAVITPFKDNKTDFAALEALLDRQIAAGVDGIVALGTTAETPALTLAEKEEILKFISQKVDKKIPVVVGVGSNNTSAMMQTIEMAAKYTPAALLVVTPYYNKPNLSGMVAHFTQAASAGLPIVLYHIPGRTGQKLSIKFFGDLLAAVPQIKAVKESDYDIAFITEMAATYGKKRINYICGNDDLWPAFLGLGSDTIITAAGNTLSPAFIKMYKLFNQGKVQEMMDIFRSAYPLITGSYFEVNPTCVKYLLAKMGLCQSDARLPLGPLSEETKHKLDAILATFDKDLLI
ncbi:MAG: 4-hydroxy-tetrahydrodipicolinate synthase [Elusimicrobiota bacterium]|jgi:4-hydroxy-tetrahydrodipicolinate synthase|nr:4-hydroxy-tetrahydrodipicolinate synthase [Elusimicrobiota bacterium]